jgi:hypothetical protein
MSTPGKQDQGELERAPGDQNGLPVISIAQPPTSLCLTFNAIAEQDLGIWNHLGVVVNWLLGACKMHLGKHLGKLLGACKINL